MWTALSNGFPTFGGEGEGESLLELWNINTLLLKVRVLSNHASWIKLGSTSSVGVASSNH